MKKNLRFVYILVTLILIVSLGLSACDLTPELRGKPDSSGTGEIAHTHRYLEVWFKDETHHWKEPNGVRF